MTTATPDQIIKRAQALIDQVRNDLAATEEFYRDQGLDPEKVRHVLAEQLTPEGKSQAQDLVQADMAEIEQTVQEELARQGKAPRSPVGAGRFRRMI